MPIIPFFAVFQTIHCPELFCIHNTKGYCNFQGCCPRKSYRR